jgi:hypothetical protein
MSPKRVEKPVDLPLAEILHRRLGGTVCIKFRPALAHVGGIDGRLPGRGMRAGVRGQKLSGVAVSLRESQRRRLHNQLIRIRSHL